MEKKIIKNSLSKNQQYLVNFFLLIALTIFIVDQTLKNYFYYHDQFLYTTAKTYSYFGVAVQLDRGVSAFNQILSDGKGLSIFYMVIEIVLASLLILFYCFRNKNISFQQKNFGTLYLAKSPFLQIIAFFVIVGVLSNGIDRIHTRIILNDKTSNPSLSHEHIFGVINWMSFNNTNAASASGYGVFINLSDFSLFFGLFLLILFLLKGIFISSDKEKKNKHWLKRFKLYDQIFTKKIDNNYNEIILNKMNFNNKLIIN